jgi:phosphoribosylformylglycinamidine synthase
VPLDLPILMKVETHNHPTAISPFPGAATGSGGEIRDEGATGRGSKPKAGLTGFSVSNLRIPDFPQPWEVDFGRPARIESALGIMIEGPIGGAAFNNEFGRPALAGYFRTLELEAGKGDARTLFGYHKPIMIAGGLGSIRREHVHKEALPAGTPIVVLGGPAMLIGLGGGAASSVASGASAEQLDFASVQRGNPEIERRCQEVIDRCTALGAENPILSIHDVGAGGLSNAIPEILNDAGRGGVIELRKVPSAEPGLSPLELWCNEAQERYVLAIGADRLPAFLAIAERERAPCAVVGAATEAAHLRVDDALLGTPAVDLPMSVLLGKTPRMTRTDNRLPGRGAAFEPEADLAEALARVLRLPSVAAKHFLVTIGDRSVGGLTARDQMVGPWQVPVADCAVTLTDFDAFTGEAMAMGERTPLAILSAPASGRMAVGEVVTNLAGADIADTGPDPAVRELDGGGGRAGSGCGTVRHGACDRRRAVPASGHQHSGGQGLPVHAHGLGAERGAAADDRPGVADRLRVRAGGRRAPHADPAARHRGGRAAVAGRSGRGICRGWAGPPWRRSSARWASHRPTWSVRSGCGDSSA